LAAPAIITLPPHKFSSAGRLYAAKIFFDLTVVEKIPVHPNLQSGYNPELKNYGN
jgi:hypothetical protein